MTPEELLAAQKRDAATGDLWFTGPESFTALAARDRRALLADNEALRKERDEAHAILRKLVERMDSDADGGDGIFEDFVERLANKARAFLAAREKTT